MNRRESNPSSLTHIIKTMTQSTIFINKIVKQEIILTSLSQIQGADVLEWIGARAEKTVAFILDVLAP